MHSVITDNAFALFLNPYTMELALFNNKLVKYVTLQASGSTLKKLEKFESGTHNDTWQCYGYLDAIAQFFYELCNR